MKLKLLLSALLAGVALGAWARYKPANWGSLPDLPEMTNGCVTLTESDYRFSGLRKIVETVQAGARYGALRINRPSGPVTIWIGGDGSELTLQGATGDSTYGGGAGLYLPSGQTLILRYVDNYTKTPTITATGGDGHVAGRGEKGSDSTSDSYGAGGTGGRGATAAGAGIGGFGGQYGYGGSFSVGAYDPGDAGDGGHGGNGGAAGQLWVFDGITVTAKPGTTGAECYESAPGGKDKNCFGGGGGGGGGAANSGGSGGGGGGKGGAAGMGGGPGDLGGNTGKPGTVGGTESGGAGGASEGSWGTTAGAGGKGGSRGTGGAGGNVWYAVEKQIDAQNMSANPATGDGKPATCTLAAIAFDYNDKELISGCSNRPDPLTLATSDGKLLDTPIEVPYYEGYAFLGYFMEPSGGEQLIDDYGKVVANKTLGTAKTLYAQWKVCEPGLGSANIDKCERGENNFDVSIEVTWLPDRHDTYVYMFYHEQNSTEWKPYVPQEKGWGDPISDQQFLATSVTSETLGDGVSGDYTFRCMLVSTRYGNGLAATNYTETVTLRFIRRDVPVYDADAKTIWANGSALKIQRDTRNPLRVVVYYDQSWNGIYEGAFTRGLLLSTRNCWVNGGFKTGIPVGGGVKIDFESGVVRGIDAGANISPGAPVNITVGADAHVTEKRGW